MKRPLVLVGFTYLLTLAAAVYLGARISSVLFWCCLALFMISVAVRRLRTALVFPAAFLTAAVAFGCFAGYDQAVVQPPRALDGTDAEVRGTVCELPYSQYGRWYYVIKLHSVSIPGAPQQFKIRLSSKSELDAGPYSEICCKLHFFRPQGGEGFSSESYYESRGIRMFAYLYEYGRTEVSPPKAKPPYYYALLLRRAMISSVDSMLPREVSGLIRGMLLGDKTALSAEAVSDFRTAGVSHLLAVSGLHMATIVQLLLLLLGLLKISSKRSAPLAGAGILCFMAVTGFVPSVVRSGLMCFLCLAAPMVSRRADPLNSLGTAVLALCLPNPYAAADVGLLLSFSAALGLILFTRPIQNWLNSRWVCCRSLRPLVHGLTGILATSVSAIVATLPVMILSFGSVSLIAPVSNLLMLVPASIMISVSAVGAVIGLCSPQSFLLMPFALLSGLLAKYLRFCARLLAQIPFASISASYGYVFLWLAGSVLLFAIAFVLRKGRKLAVTAGVLSAVMLAVGVLSYKVTSRGVTRIAVLDVGTGLAVAVTENGQSSVYGCGGYSSNTIKRYLLGRNIYRLNDLCLLTEDREENVNSAELTKRVSADCLYAPENSRYDGFVQQAAAGAQSVFLQKNSWSGQMWQSFSIQKQDCGGSTAVWMETHHTSILVLPEQADLSFLPENWMLPDFLITDLPPNKRTELDPFCTVLSMDAQDLCKYSLQSGEHTIWTGGFGAVVLELNENRRLSVRRET
ncbi:MAG: ComEC/Rec2 family competence protein [Oscillospiraceae bacterium]|jgi:competence protein ComEC|nr:ComEC/Rec2 family competence protein [Oscillospiraceae bacterium]